MNRYRYIILSCVLALISIGAQAQLPDSVYCYLKETIKTVKRKNYITTELLIYNSSNDTVVIEGFSKFIHHISFVDDFYNRNGFGFYWDYITLSNEKVSEYGAIVVSGGIGSYFGIRINGRKRKFIRIPMSEIVKKETIVITPHGLFVSDVYMRNSGIYPHFKEGYYKKRLYYNENIIAEIIVKNE